MFFFFIQFLNTGLASLLVCYKNLYSIQLKLSLISVIGIPIHLRVTCVAITIQLTVEECN